MTGTPDAPPAKLSIISAVTRTTFDCLPQGQRERTILKSTHRITIVQKPDDIATRPPVKVTQVLLLQRLQRLGTSNILCVTFPLLVCVSEARGLWMSINLRLKQAFLRE